MFWLSGKPKVKCFESALLSIHRTCALSMRLLALIFCLNISLYAHAQELDSIAIKAIVQQIDNTAELDSTVHDWSQLTGVVTDGGAELISWRNNGEVVKVFKQVGLSFGRITTTIYLQDSEPIMAIETEENFGVDDHGEIDYTSLKVVYQEINFYYKEDPFRSGEYDLDYRSIGKRVLSEQYCTTSELLYPLELIK